MLVKGELRVLPHLLNLGQHLARGGTLILGHGLVLFLLAWNELLLHKSGTRPCHWKQCENGEEKRYSSYIRGQCTEGATLSETAWL